MSDPPASSRRPSLEPRPPGRFFRVVRTPGATNGPSAVTPDATWKRRTAAALTLLSLSFAFRVPALVNASATNSDAAVVGLQAMHILDGERSALLWGSGYQTSADAFVAAAFFKAMGPTPLALMLSALSLHVVLTWLVFATLRRHFRPWTSVLLSLPLVFSPASVHTYALYPPRQAALTLAVAAFWAIDGAGSSSQLGRVRVWLFAGGAFMMLAVAADPYPLLLVPVATAFASLVAGVPAQRGVARLGVLPFFVGAAAGLAPFLLLRRAAGAGAGPLGLTTEMLAHHFDLLVAECLPWALSYKVYVAHSAIDYRPWDAPLAFRIVAIAGALVVIMVAIYGLVAIFLRGIPWAVRRLGFAGALAFPTAIVGFLLSVMVMDHFSMRYLVVLTLMLPFAAAPATHVLGPKRFALVVAPHLVASAICGWLGYGTFVRGFLPVRLSAELADDHALRAALEPRGIRYAVADYWAAYRLTFLHRERIVVVPRNPAEDRHPGYRKAWEGERMFAYVHDPQRSRETVEDAEQELRAAHAKVEKTKIGRLTVFVVER